MNLLLADENFPKTSYRYLVEQGYDIKHIIEEGLASILDEEVLALALREERIIVTFDSDFGELSFSGTAIVQQGWCSFGGSCLPRRNQERFYTNSFKNRNFPFLAFSL